ncbi:MAG: HIRAN domain-containing protein [Thermoleophilia bacterium]
MGFLDRLKGKQPTYTASAVVLSDDWVVEQIDAHDRALELRRRGEESEPNACRSCGTFMDPGFRYCPRCDTEAKRAGKRTRYWYQEVAGESHYQPGLARVVEDAARREGGGVREWVTAALVPEPTNKHDKNAVQIQVQDTEGRPAIVGYLPREQAGAYQTALAQIWAAEKSMVACRGLVQGGFQMDDGRMASYGIRLLLPLASKMRQEFSAANMEDCRQCGLPLKEGASFCGSCGTAVSD